MVPSTASEETGGGQEPLTDARLVPLALTAWCCALVVPLLPRPAAVVAAIALAALAIPVILADRRRDPSARMTTVAVLCLGGAACTLVTAAHVSVTRSGPIPVLAADAAVATVDVRVRTDPRPREAGRFGTAYVVMEADAVRVTWHGDITRVSTPVVVTAPQSWSAVRPGELVRTVARLSPAERGERPAAVLAARSPPVLLEPAGWLDRAAADLRAGLRDAVADLPARERGLVPALVVGDESRMPPSLVDDFQTAGLSHLTAVSGTNLTIVLAFALSLARWAGLRSWGLPALGVACAVVFVVVARPEPSVLRAAAMGLVGLAGLAAGSRRYGLPALATAVVALLLIDPWLGRSYGFALSVLATAGILLLAPGYTDATARWLPRFAAAAVAVPVAAQLACTPVVAVLSGSVSVVAVGANLLASPAVAPATVLGLVATLLAPLSVDLAAVPGRLAGYAARWIVEVATVAADTPGAKFAWPASVLAVAVLVLLCVAAAILAPALLRRRGLSLGIAVATVIWTLHPVQLALPLARLTGWPPTGWVLVACDVGQGDALVLRIGEHTAVVVDAGPDPGLVDSCLSDLRITRIPYLLLTHFHADHVDGLPGVLQGRAVGEIGIRPHAGTDQEARRVRAWARQSGVPATEVAPGETRAAGAVRWTVLSPAPGVTASQAAVSYGADGDEGSAENDASVVVMVEVDRIRILLTGDIEPPSQQALLRSGADLQADVLKVPHHGSRYQDAAFLAAVGPRLGLVSVGLDNDYGHPAPSTVRSLTSAGTTVGRTDLSGSVAVVHDDRGLGLVTRRRFRIDGATPANGDRAVVTPRRCEPGCRRHVGCFSGWQPRPSPVPQPPRVRHSAGSPWCSAPRTSWSSARPRPP